MIRRARSMPRSPKCVVPGHTAPAQVGVDQLADAAGESHRNLAQVRRQSERHLHEPLHDCRRERFGPSCHGRIEQVEVQVENRVDFVRGQKIAWTFADSERIEECLHGARRW